MVCTAELKLATESRHKDKNADHVVSPCLNPRELFLAWLGQEELTHDILFWSILTLDGFKTAMVGLQFSVDNNQRIVSELGFHLVNMHRKGGIGCKSILTDKH